jgi:ATP-dependent RNA helicase DHX8/PRP22
MLREHQVLLLFGETGSGKTTQVPQMILERGLLRDGMMAVTQPRRVAATSVAKRVAEERGSRVGGEVGYTVRFDDSTSADTRVKFMTDGVLVREALSDPELRKYAVVMLDEAHERSISTDLLFGLLRGVLARRRDLRLIVSSATLNTAKIAGFFVGAPTLRVPGRAYDVAIYHARNKARTRRAALESASEIALRVHRDEEEGHILLFMTGQREIEEACASIARKLVEERARERRMDAMVHAPLLILPLFGALQAAKQSAVFERVAPGTRKLIVCTNIAETSVTVQGVRYVIDPGFVKQKEFHPALGIDTLRVVPISQVSAQQRAGRAGRTAPGKCYRLYTKEGYAEMPPETVPEIARTNLANTVLFLKALGVRPSSPCCSFARRSSAPCAARASASAPF